LFAFGGGTVGADGCWVPPPFGSVMGEGEGEGEWKGEWFLVHL